MYLEHEGSFERLRRLYFRKILSRMALPRTADILDYGCGPGDFMVECKAQGYTALGIDSSVRSISMARRRGLDVLEGDWEAASLEGKSFDLIFLQSVIEHCRNPVALLRGLSHRLKESGVMIVSAPTPGPHFWDDPTHIRPYTPRSLTALAELSELRLEWQSYVFAFLLGFRFSAPIVFKCLNILPWSLGTNLIAAFGRQPGQEPTPAKS